MLYLGTAKVEMCRLGEWKKIGVKKTWNFGDRFESQP